MNARRVVTDVVKLDGYQGIASPPIVDPEPIVQLPFFSSRH
jgi:hypothetical protein